MIESPMLQKLMAQRSHADIVEVLKTRFDSVPQDVTRLLQDILDDRKLK